MQRTEHMTHTTHTPEAMAECIENCKDCHDICLRTATWSLQQRQDVEAVSTLLDCAQICATSADFMVRGSPLHGLTCYICAVICEECARECERYSQHAEMVSCAEMCRTCARSCYDMAASMGVTGESLAERRVHQGTGSYVGEAMEEVAEGVRESREEGRSGI